MEIIVATRNKHKLQEIKALLKGISIGVLSLDSFDNVPEVIEDGDTLEANAVKKAEEVSTFLKRFAIADDSGLEVEYLGGQPGVFSARFSGNDATYESNNKKLLKLLEGAPKLKRKAVFRCVIAIADKGRIIDIAEGRCYGIITDKPIGKTGFGYDPVFIPNGYKKTFAQLGIRQKNKISHRSKALKKAKKIIMVYLRKFKVK
jgi:XTP/dITP diphosphohydrolase